MTIKTKINYVKNKSRTGSRKSIFVNAIQTQQSYVHESRLVNCHKSLSNTSQHKQQTLRWISKRVSQNNHNKTQQNYQQKHSKTAL